MSTFTNNQESSQRVKIIGFERSGKDTKLDKITIEYQRTDTEKPTGTLVTSKFTSNMTNSEKELLTTAKKSGEDITMVKIFQQKDGATKGYWNLKELKPLSEYKPKAQGATKSTGFSGKSGFNEAGIKVGAVLHDAVALVSANIQPHLNNLTEAVKRVAEELLKLSYELEANVNAGKYAPKVQEAISTATSTAPAPAQDVREDWDSLDDLLSDMDSE